MGGEREIGPVNGVRAAFSSRLGADPEAKLAMSGTLYLRFSVAVDEGSHRTEDRPEPPKTTWVKVLVFEALAARLVGHLSKGAEVYCEGRLKLERRDDRDGTPRSGLSLSARTAQPTGRPRRRRAAIAAGAE